MSSGWARYAFKFGEYYGRQDVESYWVPPRLRTREWMFDGFDQRPPERHRGFRNVNDLVSHVIRKVPKSCFYSTAYYRDPNQRKMKDKGLLGADLIFDLDGDHLPGVTDGDFPTMISVIQDQAYQLWYDFLEPEFGFKSEYLQVTFSGHRGFHLHYRAPDIWGLDSNARREIVSHIKGEGVNVEALIRGPDCAWKSRVISGVDSVLNKLDMASNDNSQGRASAKDLLEIIKGRIGRPDCTVKKCGINSIQSIAEKVQNIDRRNRLIQGFESGEIKPVFGGSQGGSQLDNIFTELVKGDSSIVLGRAGETDEVVTIDLKRVIRWPTSLHGKSGMKVVEFPHERLDQSGPNPFDPLSEAVPWSMQSNTEKLRAIRSDVCYRIGDTSGTLSEGDIIHVDEATATFLVLKGWAEPIA